MEITEKTVPFMEFLIAVGVVCVITLLLIPAFSDKFSQRMPLPIDMITTHR